MHSDKQVRPNGGSAVSYFAFVDQKFKGGDDTLKELNPVKAQLVHAAMGVTGEAGELCDGLKKFCLYGKELDRTNIVEELGDLRFYMQAIQNILHISDSEIIEHNVNKLSKRYKKGYSNDEAQQRADKQEVTEQANALVVGEKIGAGIKA